MAQFLSTVTNKVDKKGRVSVPAIFRSALAGEAFNGVVLFPSFQVRAIEGAGMDQMERIGSAIDELPPFSESRANIANAVLAASHSLNFDSEGRILIPESLLVFSGVQDRATFAGLGRVFQIWSPEAYEEHQNQSREWAQANPNSIPWGVSDQVRRDG